MNGNDLVVGDDEKMGRGPRMLQVRVQRGAQTVNGVVEPLFGMSLEVRGTTVRGIPLNRIPFLGDTVASAHAAAVDMKASLKKLAKKDDAYNIKVPNRDGRLVSAVTNSWHLPWMDTQMDGRHLYSVFGVWFNKAVITYGREYVLELIALNIPTFDKLEATTQLKGRKKTVVVRPFALQTAMVLNWLCEPTYTADNPTGAGFSAPDPPGFTIADLRKAYARLLCHWVLYRHTGPNEINGKTFSITLKEAVGNMAPWTASKWPGTTPNHSGKKAALRKYSFTAQAVGVLSHEVSSILPLRDGKRRVIKFASSRASWYDVVYKTTTSARAARSSSSSSSAFDPLPELPAFADLPGAPEPDVQVRDDALLPIDLAMRPDAPPVQDEFKEVHDNAIQSGASLADNVMFRSVGAPIRVDEKETDALGRVLVSFCVITPYVFAKEPLCHFDNVLIPIHFQSSRDLTSKGVLLALRRWLKEMCISDSLPLLHVYKVKRYIPVYKSGKLPGALRRPPNNKTPALVYENRFAAHRDVQARWSGMENHVVHSATWNSRRFILTEDKSPIVQWFTVYRTLFRPVMTSELYGSGQHLSRTVVSREPLTPSWPVPKWLPRRANKAILAKIAKKWNVYVWMCPACNRRCYSPAPGPPPLNEPWLCAFDKCALAGPLNEQSKCLRVSLEARRLDSMEAVPDFGSGIPEAQMRARVLRAQAPIVIRTGTSEFATIESLGQTRSASSIPCIAKLPMPPRRFGVNNTKQALGLQATEDSKHADAFQKGVLPTYRCIQDANWLSGMEGELGVAPLATELHGLLKAYSDRVRDSLRLSDGLLTDAGLIQTARARIAELLRFEYTEQEKMLVTLHGGSLNPALMDGADRARFLRGSVVPGSPVDANGHRLLAFLGDYEHGLADHVYLPNRLSGPDDFMAPEAAQAAYEMKVRNRAASIRAKKAGSMASLFSSTRDEEEEKEAMDIARESLKAYAPRAPVEHRLTKVDASPTPNRPSLSDQCNLYSQELYGGRPDTLPIPIEYVDLVVYVQNARQLCDLMEKFRTNADRNKYVGFTPTALDFDAPNLMGLGEPSRDPQETLPSLVALATQGQEVEWTLKVIVPFAPAKSPFATISGFLFPLSVAPVGNAYAGYACALQLALDDMCARHRIPRMHLVSAVPDEGKTEWNGVPARNAIELCARIRSLYKPPMDQPSIQSAAKYMWRDQGLFPGATKPGDLCVYEDLFKWRVGVCRCPGCQELSWAFVPPGGIGPFAPWCCGYTQCNRMGPIAHAQKRALLRLTHRAFEAFKGDVDKLDSSWLVSVQLVDVGCIIKEDVRTRVAFLYDSLKPDLVGVSPVNVPYHPSIARRVAPVNKSGKQNLSGKIDDRMYYGGNVDLQRPRVSVPPPLRRQTDIQALNTTGLLSSGVRKKLSDYLKRNAAVWSQKLLAAAGKTAEEVKQNTLNYPQPPAAQAWARMDGRAARINGLPEALITREPLQVDPFSRWIGIYSHPHNVLTPDRRSNTNPNAPPPVYVTKWTAQEPVQAFNIDNTLHRLMVSQQHLSPPEPVEQNLFELDLFAQDLFNPDLSFDVGQVDPGFDIDEIMNASEEVKVPEVKAPEEVKVPIPLKPVKRSKGMFFYPPEKDEWFAAVFGVDAVYQNPLKHTMLSFPVKGDGESNSYYWRGYSRDELIAIAERALENMKKYRMYTYNVVESDGRFYKVADWVKRYPDTQDKRRTNNVMIDARRQLKVDLDALKGGGWPRSFSTKKKRAAPTTLRRDPEKRIPLTVDISQYDMRTSNAIALQSPSAAQVDRILSLYNPDEPNEGPIAGTTEVWANYLDLWLRQGVWKKYINQQSKKTQWEEDLVLLRQNAWPPSWVRDMMDRRMMISQMRSSSPEHEIAFLRMRDRSSPVFNGYTSSSLGAIWSVFHGSSASTTQSSQDYSITRMIGSSVTQIGGPVSHVEGSDSESPSDSDAPLDPVRAARHGLRRAFPDWLRQMPPNHEGRLPNAVSWREIEMMGRRMNPDGRFDYMAILRDVHGRYGMLWVSDRHNPSVNSNRAAFIYPLCMIRSFASLSSFKRALKKHYNLKSTVVWMSFINYIASLSREVPRSRNGRKPSLLPREGDERPLQYRRQEDTLRHARVDHLHYNTLQHHLFWENGPRSTMSSSGDDTYTFPQGTVAFRASSVDPTETSPSHVFTGYDDAVNGSWRGRYGANGIVETIQTTSELSFWRPTKANMRRLHAWIKKNVPEEKQSLVVEAIADNPRIDSIDPAFIGMETPILPVDVVKSIGRVDILAVIFSYDQAIDGALTFAEDQPELVEQFERSILFPYLEESKLSGWVLPPRTLLSSAGSQDAAIPRLSFRWNSPGVPRTRVEPFDTKLQRVLIQKGVADMKEASKFPWFSEVVQKTTRAYYDSIDRLVQEDSKRDWDAERQSKGFTKVPVTWRIYPYVNLNKNDPLLVVLQAYGDVYHKHVMRDTLAPYDGMGMPTPHPTRLDTLFYNNKPGHKVQASPIAREPHD